MPPEYLPIAVMFTISLALVVVVLFMSRLFGPYHPERRKLEPYESGMDPIGSGMRRFFVRFYLTAVLFILFDVELIFFLPWAVVFRKLGLFALIEMGIFLAFLLIGYAYVWRKGALEWE